MGSAPVSRITRIITTIASGAPATSQLATKPAPASRDAILRIKGADELLAGDRRLRESIRLRNPYVDPISLLQVDLLQRWRAAGRPEDETFRALVATVNGIAAGIQNTG